MTQIFTNLGVLYQHVIQVLFLQVRLQFSQLLVIKPEAILTYHAFKNQLLLLINALLQLGSQISNELIGHKVVSLAHVDALFSLADIDEVHV